MLLRETCACPKHVPALKNIKCKHMLQMRTATHLQITFQNRIKYNATQAVFCCVLFALHVFRIKKVSSSSFFSLINSLCKGTRYQNLAPQVFQPPSTTVLSVLYDGIFILYDMHSLYQYSCRAVWLHSLLVSIFVGCRWSRGHCIGNEEIIGMAWHF